LFDCLTKETSATTGYLAVVGFWDADAVEEYGDRNDDGGVACPTPVSSCYYKAADEWAKSASYVGRSA